MGDLLMDAAGRARGYVDGVPRRPAFPRREAIERLRELGGPLPDGRTDPEIVLALLDEVGSAATVASTGGRYFGFVMGGSLPVALATNWLATAWDQNAGVVERSPVAAAVEEIALDWLVDLLGLPPGTGGGFVTGGTMANFAGLAAARHAILERYGWSVEEDGLFGAPPVRVVVGEEVHPSLLKALSLLGLGRRRVVRVPVDRQGRMRRDALPELDGSTILCIQAGNVNTGAFDPADELCAAAHAAGAWVHVDGAVGLWAAASPTRAHLARGVMAADSWAADAHKWLNVPYDSGLVFCRYPGYLRAAMASSTSDIEVERREPNQFTPELSRRARGVEIWAALRSLGRAGLADLVERCCRHASRFADGLRSAGYQILNDVVLNQVLVSFGTPDETNRVIAAIQEDGTCWFGGRVWQGQTVMRISVTSWATTDEDVEKSLEAILRLARGQSRFRVTGSAARGTPAGDHAVRSGRAA